jgi:hypothetical protein
MTDSNWTFSQEFYSKFHISRSGPQAFTSRTELKAISFSFWFNPIDLAAQIESAKASPPIPARDVLQAFSVELAKLTKSLVDATGSLPAYDQRQCELVCLLTVSVSEMFILPPFFF